MPSPALSYPLESPPPAGHAHVVAPGIHWIRHSLPMALDHINVWLLSDRRSCTIVDTGINNRTTRAAWPEILEQLAPDKRVERVIATHLHPDHCGLAGWLSERYDCPLLMTRTEYLLCRTLCHDSSLDVPAAATRFYRAAGLTTKQLDDYAKAFGGFGRAVTPLPPAYVRLKDGDQLDLHGESWDIIVGTGHSPEHACLFNAQRNLLISGDQILPRISSIIAVWPTEAEANPLAEWLTSCRMLIDRLPPDVLVLPSHGLPFNGAHARLTELIEHHELLLESLRQRTAEPQRVIDVFDLLFNSEINDSNLIMAVGETIAHFNYLLSNGEVTRTLDDQGVAWYQRS